MGKRSRARVLTVGAAVVLTLLFGLLALVLYLRLEAGMVKKHSRDQQLLTQLAAIALGQRVDNRLHQAEELAARFGRLSEATWSQALANQTLPEPGTNIVLLYPDGRVDFYELPTDLEALKAAVFPWRGTPEAILTNPFPPSSEARQVAVLVPVGSRGGQVAQLGLIFPFGSLVDTLFSPQSAPDYISISLLDEQGTVVANTRHPEMLGRQVPPAGQSCLPCHAGFDLEQRMLAGESGVGQLQVGGGPLAMLAFTPVEVLGRRWSLSLSEPYSTILADTRQGFRAITVLLGLLLLVAILALAIILQYRVQRRRAEERAELAERRATLDQQLRQNEQLAALGRMTSQIAHQINTPLATLGLNVSYLQTEVARRLGRSSREIEEVSSAIAEEIERLKRVVNDYLRFSRLPEPNWLVESLRDLVQNFLDFIEPEARERGVRLTAEWPTETSTVHIDPDLFRQLLLNLVRNSFEAMPGGGVLRLRLERAGSDWALSLEDTGRGIPSEILPRIFEPFFTTKKDGTGLGLAHARRVIEQHRGTMTCSSQPGQGATFLIRLPAAPAESPSPEELTVSSVGG